MQEYEVVTVRERIEDGWDCESVTSLYTNTENHPAVIIESGKVNRKIKLSKKTGIPLDVLPAKKGKAAGDKEHDDDDDSDDSDDIDTMRYVSLARITRLSLSPSLMPRRTHSTTSTNLGMARRKNETPEERRERKRLAKEAKKSKRLQKKNLKQQFKKEELRQASTSLQVQIHPTGVRF